MSESESLAIQSCPTFCHPTDYSPPGSSVHGILQARILEWVAMPSSRRSQPRDQTWDLLHFRQILYHLNHQGSLDEWTLTKEMKS